MRKLCNNSKQKNKQSEKGEVFKIKELNVEQIG